MYHGEHMSPRGCLDIVRHELLTRIAMLELLTWDPIILEGTRPWTFSSLHHAYAGTLKMYVVHSGVQYQIKLSMLWKYFNHCWRETGTLV
jgi:hypothetical protein